MAQYTTSIRNLCQVLSNKEDYTDSINAVVLEAAPKIFDFSFPFYDETKKIDWEVRFLKHFYIYGKTHSRIAHRYPKSPSRIP